MNATEQAKFLINRFSELLANTGTAEYVGNTAKECALIFADGILKHNHMIQEHYDGYQTCNTPMKLYKEVLNPDKKFWNEVKTEIKKP